MQQHTEPFSCGSATRALFTMLAICLLTTSVAIAQPQISALSSSTLAPKRPADHHRQRIRSFAGRIPGSHRRARRHRNPVDQHRNPCLRPRTGRTWFGTGPGHNRERFQQQRDTQRHPAPSKRQGSVELPDRQLYAIAVRRPRTRWNRLRQRLGGPLRPEPRRRLEVVC